MQIGTPQKNNHPKNRKTSSPTIKARNNPPRKAYANKADHITGKEKITTHTKMTASKKTAPLEPGQVTGVIDWTERRAKSRKKKRGTDPLSILIDITREMRLLAGIDRERYPGRPKDTRSVRIRTPTGKGTARPTGIREIGKKGTNTSKNKRKGIMRRNTTIGQAGTTITPMTGHMKRTMIGSTTTDKVTTRTTIRNITKNHTTAGPTTRAGPAINIQTDRTIDCPSPTSLPATRELRQRRNSRPTSVLITDFDQ